MARSTQSPLTSALSEPQHKFLTAYAVVGSLRQAARLAEVNRRQHYHWLQSSPDYAAEFVIAKEEVAERLEEEARRRAILGVEQPVFYAGKQCGVIRRYSDALLILLLKGTLPDKYRDRSTVDTQFPIENMPLETLREEAIRLGISLPDGEP